MSWIPLHVHSTFSILDALGSVSELAKRAAASNMSSIALTDNGNLYGVVDFYKACSKVGVKAIIGMETYLAPNSRHEKQRVQGFSPSTSTVLLAKNQAGYHNLCKLATVSHLEGFYYVPRVDKELLEQHNEGLICLMGGTNSTLGFYATNRPDAFAEQVDWFHKTFGEDLFFELQRHEMGEQQLQDDGFYQEAWLIQKYQDYIERQKKVNALLIETGKERGIPLIATNDSRYLDQPDWYSHEILINIQSGEPCELLDGDFRSPNPKRKSFPSHQYQFKTAEEMAELFADIPEALANTLEVANQCDVHFDFNAKHYPVYHPPGFEGDQNEIVGKFLRQLCEEGISVRYTPERLAKVQEVYPDKDPMQVVRDRLEREMGVITSKTLGDYLLIVWDVIHWAKTHGIPVGPGRGSGAGSIILYLIGITDIEPLRFNLFFERFINPERLSYPDIDVDICMDKREQVIDYTVDKYGKDNVAQIITFGTIKAKMAIKDVARVLSVPLAKVNALAKLVPEDPNMTLDKALEVDADLAQIYSEDEEVSRIIDIGRKIEGATRSTGIHAAGVIISGEPLTNNIPLCRAKDSEMAATQFAMKPAESVGMLKVDFLGLKTLTSIQQCVDAIEEASGTKIDWVNLPLDNPEVFALLNHGKTLGIFQMESGGMQDLARQLHLDKFEEIIAVLSLYRPGPMDMIPSFIARKHGREAIEYDHPWMEEILSETYGIMVYQEQVMQIAQKLANYSLGEGDVLRRAMGKKDAEQMAKEREKFKSGCIGNDIDEGRAAAIFDKMEKFAAYGFNKSHAAAYGYLTYVTAYLKANYPKEWMAALMTCDRDDTAKIAKFIGEAQAMGIAILPPDVNEAGDTFTALPAGIRFAITGIKGVGAGVVEAIIEERKKKGPFKSLYNFFTRTDPAKVGKKAVEGLVEAGCFDFTGWTRDEMRESIEEMYAAASKEAKEEAVGMMSLFATESGQDEGRFAKPPKVKVQLSKRERLLKEKELLGFFLTGHPMQEYQQVLKRLSCVPLGKAEQFDHDQLFRAAFIIEEVATRISHRTQRKFAITIVSDGLERFELPIWSDLYEEKGHLLHPNQLVYAVIQVDRREGGLRLSCKWLDDLTQVNEVMIKECDDAYSREKMRATRMNYAKSKNAAETKMEEKSQKLSITLDTTTLRMSEILQLKDVLARAHGEWPAEFTFARGQHPYAVLHLSQGVAITPTLQKELKTIKAITEIQ